MVLFLIVNCCFKIEHSWVGKNYELVMETMAYDESCTSCGGASNKLASDVITGYGTINYQYTEEGWLQSTQYVPVGSIATLIENEYDAGGNIINTAIDTRTVAEYAYDSTNFFQQSMTERMTGKNRRIDFTYDAVGHKKSISYPNKTRMNYDYGTAYWMTKADGVYVKNGVEQLINKNVITQRDSVGNITQKEINTGAVSYVYDDKYRLTGYTNTNANPSSQSFTFDYRGNRLSVVATPGGTTSYTVGDNNMVTAAGGESISHDGRGNVTGRGNTQYEWDYKNRLVKADKEGVQEDLYYTYNNADRMLSRTKWNKKVTYYYNGNQLLCEKDETGRLSKVFINDSEGLLGFTILNYKPNGEFSNYEPVYYLFNDQGSVTTLTNEVGRPIKHYLYDPYGNLTNTTTDPNNNFTFIGRYGGFKDWDSGLIQFQHRWYDSALGRWMSRDPIGVRGGVNLYVYGNDDPVNVIDPLGLCNKKQKDDPESKYVRWNYCGKDWSAGIHWTKEIQNIASFAAIYSKDPINDLDDCCYQHDVCAYLVRMSGYAHGSITDCNVALVRCASTKIKSYPIEASVILKVFESDIHKGDPIYGKDR